uniref:Uncharacterized protein n=1 Tax=Arion vulgaris TaxID=1028688 RepID=A0A0B6Y7I7_9EUPU
MVVFGGKTNTKQNKNNLSKMRSVDQSWKFSEGLPQTQENLKILMLPYKTAQSMMATDYFVNSLQGKETLNVGHDDNELYNFFFAFNIFKNC